MHDEGIAVDISPCGGFLGERLDRVETAELVWLRASDEPHLGIASAHLRLVGFVVMDDRIPAQPETVGFGTQVDLGVAQLLDKEAIAGLNPCLAAKMPDEIGDRERLSGPDELTISDKHEADDNRCRKPAQQTCYESVPLGGKS